MCILFTLNQKYIVRANHREQYIELERKKGQVITEPKQRAELLIILLITTFYASKSTTYIQMHENNFSAGQKQLTHNSNGSGTKPTAISTPTPALSESRKQNFQSATSVEAVSALRHYSALKTSTKRLSDEFNRHNGVVQGQCIIVVVLCNNVFSPWRAPALSFSHCCFFFFFVVLFFLLFQRYERHASDWHAKNKRGRLTGDTANRQALSSRHQAPVCKSHIAPAVV